MTTDRAMAIIRANRDKSVRFRWPLCEVCKHPRIAHAREPSGGYRCHYKGKKRKGERCDCMRYRGELKVIPR